MMKKSNKITICFKITRSEFIRYQGIDFLDKHFLIIKQINRKYHVPTKKIFPLLKSYTRRM